MEIKLNTRCFGILSKNLNDINDGQYSACFYI